MASYYPDDDCLENLINNSTSGGTVNIKAIDPLDYNQNSGDLSINNASLTSNGVVTILDQSFAGVKNLQNGLKLGGGSNTINSISSDGLFTTVSNSTLSTQQAIKTYIDNVKYSAVSWQQVVKDFWDASLGLPLSAQNGDRLICSHSGNGWIKNYIYTYVNSWSGIIPVEGFTVYIDSQNNTWNFNGVDWVRIGISVDHTDLQNKGINSHGSIDNHISDGTIHYTQAQIDHANILNKGNNSHGSIDNHISDGTIHFTKGSVSHTQITDIGNNSHSSIDGKIITYDSYLDQSVKKTSQPTFAGIKIYYGLELNTIDVTYDGLYYSITGSLKHIGTHRSYNSAGTLYTDSYTDSNGIYNIDTAFQNTYNLKLRGGLDILTTSQNALRLYNNLASASIYCDVDSLLNMAEVKINDLLKSKLIEFFVVSQPTYYASMYLNGANLRLNCTSGDINMTATNNVNITGNLNVNNIPVGTQALSTSSSPSFQSLTTLITGTGAQSIRIQPETAIYFDNVPGNSYIASYGGSLYLHSATDTLNVAGSANFGGSIDITNAARVRGTFVIGTTPSNSCTFNMTAGALTINSDANQINIHSTDSVYINNTSDATSSTQAPFCCLGGCAINKNLRIGSSGTTYGVKFNETGNFLNYYEELILNNVFSTGNNTCLVEIVLCRVGRVVTASFFQATLAATANSSISAPINSIPAQFCPTRAADLSVSITNNNSVGNGRLIVNTDGSIIFWRYPNNAFQNNSGIGNPGNSACQVSWIK